MTPISKHMRPLKIELLAGLLQSAFLIGIVLLLLSGCAGLQKFPTKYLYEFDPKTPVCAQYEITDYTNLKYKWVRDIPFIECPAIFGFIDSDVPKVLQWGQDSIQYGKTHCK